MNVTWAGWAIAAAIPGLVSLMVIPLLIHRLYPPAIKETPNATELAHGRLRELGKVKRVEWIMLACFVLLLTLWILADQLSLHATVTALLGLAVLLVTGVLQWDDVLNERGAWDTLIWFAALVMVASFLNELGLIPWFGSTVGEWFSGVGWLPAFVGLSLITFTVTIFLRATQRT